SRLRARGGQTAGWPRAGPRPTAAARSRGAHSSSDCTGVRRRSHAKSLPLTGVRPISTIAERRRRPRPFRSRLPAASQSIRRQQEMLGQMMDMPLQVSSILRHAARHFGDTEVVSRRVEGDIHRYTYAQCEERSRQLASALAKAGIATGDRVATLAWNGYRHLELYYGVAGMGAV